MVVCTKTVERLDVNALQLDDRVKVTLRGGQQLVLAVTVRSEDRLRRRVLEMIDTPEFDFWALLAMFREDKSWPRGLSRTVTVESEVEIHQPLVLRIEATQYPMTLSKVLSIS